MRLAIFSAFPQELRCSLQGLRAERVLGGHPFHIFLAQRSSSEIFLIQTGIGLQNSEDALKFILQEHRPDFVLSIGFGGALYSGAEIGELIWASRGLLVNDGVTETIDLSDGKEIAGRLAETIAIREGSVLTLGRRMAKSEIKSEYYQGLPSPVCDMETFPLARISVEKGIQFFAIRCITDRADEDIPPALYNVVDESGHYRFSRALALLFRNPWLVPASAKLGRNSMIASRNLWSAVRHIIDAL